MARRSILTKFGVDPIRKDMQIVNPDGTPTDAFLRNWLGQRSKNVTVATDIDSVIALVNQLAATNITTTAPITGGGLLSGPPAPISHQTSGVIPDTYGDATNVAQITVDQWGHVTSVVDVPISGGGGGGAWSLLGSRDFGSSPGTAYTLTGLTATDILVIMVGVVSAATGFPIVRLSVDNGSSYYFASGDYLELLATGNTPNNNSGIGMGNTNTTAAKTGYALISGLNVNGTPKIAQTNQSGTGIEGTKLFVASTAPVDAIEFSRQGANMTAGIVYVLGR